MVLHELFHFLQFSCFHTAMKRLCLIRHGHSEHNSSSSNRAELRTVTIVLDTLGTELWSFLIHLCICPLAVRLPLFRTVSERFLLESRSHFTSRFGSLLSLSFDISACGASSQPCASQLQQSSLQRSWMRWQLRSKRPLVSCKARLCL